jgi:CBS domain-containing protein
MSTRAAWRLEGAGLGPVYDYVAGKTDWLAAGLPYEGSAQLVGSYLREHPPTVSVGGTFAEARAAREAAGFGPVVVVNAAGVVLGVLRSEDLDRADAGDEKDTVDRSMHFGVSTVRPSEEVAQLAHRMQHAGTSRVVVTRSDGVLVGVFVSDDVHVHRHTE